jgi:hypothetical protein
MDGLWRCTNTECRGDCTWCNRADVENQPIVLTQDVTRRLLAEQRDINLALADENRVLKARVAQVESRAQA